MAYNRFWLLPALLANLIKLFILPDLSWDLWGFAQLATICMYISSLDIDGYQQFCQKCCLEYQDLQKKMEMMDMKQFIETYDNIKRRYLGRIY